MKNPFYFAPEQYDFWPIYEAIKKYYPIGISENGKADPLHLYYPGLDVLNEIIYENIGQQKNFRQRWGNFLKSLQKELSKPTIGLPSSYPCFYAHVELERKREADTLRSKELHFAVSLLGPFYTIFGLDRTDLSLEREISPYEQLMQDHAYLAQKRKISPEEQLIHNKAYFSATHAITCSPFIEYEHAFLLIQNRISEKFKGFRFVPYEIYTMCLEGLLVESGSNSPDDGTIYKALFNDLVNPAVAVRGDKRYGYEQWAKNKPTDPEYTFYGSQAEFELLRKKWKVVKVNKVMKGNLTFGMSGSEFDFTLLTKSEEASQPSSRIKTLAKTKTGKAKGDHWYLEVLQVSKNSLVLGMHHIGKTSELHENEDIATVSFDCIPS